GTQGYYVNIMTFHGFASEVISSYPEKFPIEKGSEPLSNFERFEIFEDLILNSNLKDLKPLGSPLHYLDEVIKRISELKREYIDPEKFATILDSEKIELEQVVVEYWEEQKQKADNGKKAKTKLSAELLKRIKNHAKQKELHTLYTKYSSELQKRKRYDFDDMISLVVQAFESDEELLLDYQERFQYILVDEYQDTNASQNKIVELLGSFWEDDPNIFVVGDPHQSIFRFQGASTENMLEFISRYPGTQVITLKTGYRCYQEIYDAAHELISHNVIDFAVGADALKQKLHAFKTGKSEITTYEAESETLELLFIVEEIQKLQKSGVPLDEIAVLYRNNKEASTLQEILAKWELPFELSIGGNVLEDLLILQLLNFLQVLRDVALGNETEQLFEAMQYSWLGLDRISVYKLARIAGKLNKTVGEILELQYEDITENYGLTKTEFQTVVTFKQKLISWYNSSKNMLFHEWFSLLLSKDNGGLAKEGEEQKPDGFGFMEFVLGQTVKTNHLYAINSLYSVVKQFVSADRQFGLDQFLQRIAIMREHTLKIPIEDFKLTKNRIALSTAHSAKGKEWQYVFVKGCVDKKWGNGRSRELLPLPDSILTNVDIAQKEKNEDDRRLFYVALTRASKKAYITWSKTRTDGKDLLGSLFITELGDGITPTTEATNKKLLDNSERLLEKLLSTSPINKMSYTAQEREFFTQLVAEFKLSVTALNNYLKDPHEFMINSLLRVPRAKTPALSFGTAVHFALEQLYGELQRTGTLLSKEKMMQQFEYALKKEFLTATDFTDRLEHGMQVLHFYYDNTLSGLNGEQLKSPLFVEKFFGGKLNKTVLFDGVVEIQLSGRIDRVDLLNQEQKTVRVIDYKTGSPKSENVIIGEASTGEYSARELELPQTIRGRLQRQMVFYKLLAELDKTFSFSVEQVEFDFVEPDGTHKDKHTTRRFTVSDQAVTDLKQLIIEVMREIRELRFLENSDIIEKYANN
ncbi:ATP-dependent helicase, partial [Candidatus Woesebacteria bacterium]|nr:ATP-dependent helicase [Candidatus Woesebacteria bacterium]